MAASIPYPSSALKDQALALLHPAFIGTVAQELGLTWRDTPLALPNLVALFARQVLGGNLSMPELARRAGSRFTLEAYCTARMKLPIPLLHALLRKLGDLGQAYLGQRPQMRWKGHRLWHMDGPGISMPDTPELQACFGQSGNQKPGCGFPVAHVLCLFDVAGGLLGDCIIAPLRTHDLADASKLHPGLGRGDVLVADRACESYTHVALLQAAGLHGIFPAHQQRRIDFRCKRRKRARYPRQGARRPTGGRRTARRRRPIYDREVVRSCGRRDHIVRWRKPTNQPRWMTPEAFDALPHTIEVRELRRRVGFADGRQREITLVTTLTDERRYPAEELIAVLQARWAVETNLRHLKTTMKMNVLRSQTVAGVQKELWMYMIVYNAVRLVMLAAAAQQRVAVHRISFADALYWVRHGDLNRPLPALQIVPHRPDRLEPRVRKRNDDHYGLMTQPRAQMRKALLRKGVRR